MDTHAQKVRMARKMLMTHERRSRTSIFQSRAWRTRREYRTGIKMSHPLLTFNLPWWKRAIEAVKRLFARLTHTYA